MIERKPTIREIDEYFRELFGAAGGNARNIRLIEPAVHLLDYCRKNLDRESFEHYAALFGHAIRGALAPETIALLNHDSLIALSGILSTTESAGESLPGQGASIAGLIRRRIAYGFLCLEDRQSAERWSGEAEIETFLREIAAIRESAHCDRTMLAVAFEGKSNIGVMRLGKIVGARAEIVITGEGSPWRKIPPDAVFEGYVRSEGSGFIEQVKLAVAVAERIFAEGYGVRALERLPRRYRFHTGDPETVPGLVDYFSGESAGLGFALLAMTAIDSLRMRPRRRLIRGDCAFTGRIDGYGNVLPVSDEYLEYKMRAVFSSPCRTFVVPLLNALLAKRLLDELRSGRPERPLTIVPVITVREAYEDDRIARECRVSPGEIFLGRMKRRVKLLVTAAALFLAGATLLAFLPSYLEHETTRCAFEHDRLSFYNSHGYRFASFEPPYNMFNPERAVAGMEIEAIDPMLQDTAHARSQYHYLRDVNKDGRDETVFIGLEASPEITVAAGRLHVHLFSSKGEELWHVPLWDTLAVMYRDTVCSFREFELYRTELTDADGDGYEDLFILTRHRSEGLSALVMVSLGHGAFRTFAHLGYLSTFMILDYDNNGKKEIIAAGLGGNPINGPVFAVLDPDLMEGSSPRREWPRFMAYPDDVARQYVWLPTSCYCAMHRECDRAEACSIAHEDSGAMRIGSCEFNHALLFFFNKRWECIGVEPSSYFAAAYRKLAAGNPGMDPLEIETVKMRRSVQYWHGDHWEGRPADGR